MTGMSRKDKSKFLSALERIEDERARYFLMMFCDALADFATGRRSRSHRHGVGNTGPAQLAEIARRMNG